MLGDTLMIECLQELASLKNSWLDTKPTPSSKLASLRLDSPFNEVNQLEAFMHNLQNRDPFAYYNRNPQQTNVLGNYLSRF